MMIGEKSYYFDNYGIPWFPICYCLIYFVRAWLGR